MAYIPQTMRRIAAAIGLADALSAATGRAFAWCIVALTGVISYEVFSRYVLARPHDWVFDVSYMLYGALFMMTGAYALAQNAHVRGDFMYSAFPPRLQAGIDLVLYLLFFVPGVVALVWAGYGFAADSWAIHEGSPLTPDGPPQYPFKAVIPLAGALRAVPAHRRLAAAQVGHRGSRCRPPARDAARRRLGGAARMRTEIRFGLGMMAAILMACIVLFPSPGEMTNAHVGLLMLALVVFAIMLGFPAAFTLMGMGVLFALFAFKGDAARTLELVVQRAYAVMANDVLISIPLFVFMGYLVERANLIAKLFRAMHLALARLPGALAVATLATCALFATATGIIGAVVTVMGLLAMPAMLRAGYSVKLASGVITAGGCLGILIPPSVMLIIYGATAGVSVVQLYAGAILPGLMLTGLYIVFVILVAKLRPDCAPPLPVAERQVELPAFARAAAAQGRDRALTTLLTAVRGKRNAGVSTRSLVQYCIVGLLPLLGFLVLLGLAYQGLTPIGAALPDTGGVNVAEASARASSDAVLPGADAVLPADSAAPGAFWLAAALGAGLLAVFYGWFTLARLEMLKMLLVSFFPLAALILAVLGTIIFGLATPTEAAAIGSLGGLLLAAAYRQLNFGVLRESVALTAKTSAMVCWLFVGSSIFSAAFALLGGQELIERWVLSLDLTPLQFMLLAQLIIFLLGWPLDWAEIIVIFVPIFVPLLAHFEINPLFFGLLVALNLQTAFLSPPVAMAAFYLRGVAPPGVTLNQIFAGMLPFMAIQIVAIVLLYAFPAIGLWLPHKMYG